eukprot:GHVN01089523.1.p1 GENE.GHVN01089523.1~~GHVN01089523.1.p1  ORF type:complete len:281 (+),score=22.98 GHVN01089523.1:58-900(+)
MRLSTFSIVAALAAGVAWAQDYTEPQGAACTVEELNEIKQNVSRLEIEVAKKDDVIKELRASIYIMETKAAGSKDETYLFSKDQFVAQMRRLCDFGIEVYEVSREWIASPVLDIFHSWSKRKSEAASEINKLFEPMLAPLQPHWTKAKTGFSGFISKGQELYNERGAPMVKRGAEHGKIYLLQLSDAVKDGVTLVNDKVTVVITPLLESRPSLKQYFPEGALDRLFFFLYLEIMIYFVLKLLMRFIVRPIKWCFGVLFRSKRSRTHGKLQEEKKKKKKNL